MADVAQAVAEQALEAAGVGGWNFDIASARLTWTRVTFLIHDMEPGEPPPIEQAIKFYAPQARPLIEAAVRNGLATGAPWDLELPLVTAKGRPIWVRACGIAIREAGRTVQLTGSFQDVTARRELAERAERLSAVARQTTNSVIITGVDGRTEWVNDAFCRLTGFALAEFCGRAPGELLQGPDTDPGTVAVMRECLARGEGFEVEVVNYTRQRDPYWIAISCTPLRNPAGGLTGFIAVETDITVRRHAENEARREAVERQRAEALLRDVLEALPSGVAAYDQSERLVLTNPAFANMFPVLAAFGRPGCSLENLIRHGAENGQYPEAGATPGEREKWVSAYLAAHRAPGAPRALLLPDGRFVQARERRSETGNLVCIRTDTTELKRAEAELRRQAERDPLTGLANRSAFLDALRRHVEGGSDTSPRQASGSLLMFDIDYFKQINDTLGHDLGDALLIEVGRRLRENFRTEDVAARLGGDEFAVLMPGLASPRAVTERMGAIQAALAQPVQIGHRQLSATISGGVATYPGDGRTGEQLLKNADLAMYEAKRTGRARWCAFAPTHGAAQQQHSRLAIALRTALADGAIAAALQPKRRLGGAGGHAGFEALARWHDGTKWVSPAEFVPVAEEVGLLGPLGRVVMETALARMRALHDLGHRPGRVAVNLSGPQLLEQSFVPDTIAALARHRLAPTDLECEVAETVLLGRTAERIDKVLRELHALGITLALDNFGTGVASIAHLAGLPIARLKIDRSFVAEIGQTARGETVVRSVIGLARTLGMRSLAEGVETPEQLALLEAAGCDEAQGYLFARPLHSLDEAAAYLAGRRAVAR